MSSASQSSSLMGDWITIENARAFVGPVATVIASIVAAVFATAQWCVAKAQKDIAYDKLKLELFEKRYAIYEAAKELIEYILQGKGGRVEDVAFMRKHYITLDEARFFFDPEIQTLLTNVHEECEGYLVTVAERDMLNPEVDPKAWREMGEKVANQRAKLREMAESLPKYFENALAFKQATQLNPSNRRNVCKRRKYR
jgi:hypothetical protein